MKPSFLFIIAALITVIAVSFWSSVFSEPRSEVGNMAKLPTQSPHNP